MGKPPPSEQAARQWDQAKKDIPRHDKAFDAKHGKQANPR